MPVGTAIVIFLAIALFMGNRIGWVFNIRPMDPMGFFFVMIVIIMVLALMGVV